MMLRPALSVAGLAAVLGYAAYHNGGVRAEDWTFCILLLGLIGLSVWSVPPYGGKMRPLPLALRAPIVLLPAYLLFQWVPLPAFVLRILSPARATLLQALHPIFPSVSWGSISLLPSSTFTIFLSVLAYALTFLLVRETLWRIANRPWILMLPLIFTGGIEATLGLLGFLADPEHEVAKGTYGDRNQFANLLEMTLPFAALYTLVLFLRARRDGGSSRQVVQASLAGAASIAMIAGILYSLSRTGFAAMLFSSLVMGLLLARVFSGTAPRLAAIAAPVALVALFILLPSDRLLARFGELVNRGGLADKLQAEPWKESLHVFATYPVFGCGAGAYAATLPRRNSASEPPTNFAYNDYVQGLAELGIAGFAILALFIISILIMAVRSSLDDGPFEFQALLIACVGALAAIFLHSLFEFNFFIPANALLLAWIAAIVAASRSLTVQGPAIINVGGAILIEARVAAE